MEKYFAAIYVRLSKEEEKIYHSSIENQKKFILNYLKEHVDVIVCNIYIDNGYSGTNFERPAFLSMMEQIKKRKINCIVVKDFSRLGRNFIETSKYIEKIFPFLGIRFISICDSYDSLTIESSSCHFFVPIKNLINDAYCYDISIKIRSQLEVKRKNGEFLAPFAVYGYQKDPNQKNSIIVDRVAAKMVRKIFNWKLEGLSTQKIADLLNEWGILSPMGYKQQMGLNFYSSFKTNTKTKWTPMAILRILKNPIYIGTLEQGKQSTLNYKIKKQINKPKEQWICIENHHQPIIEKPLFDKVQRILQADTRISPIEKKAALLSGLLYCGDCNESMIKKINSSLKNQYIYYICSTYKRREGCESHCIQQSKIEQVIFSLIQNYIFTLLDIENINNKIDTKVFEKKLREEIEEEKERKWLEQKQYQFYIQKLEEDYKEDLIKEKEYLFLKIQYNEEKIRIEQIIERLKNLTIENKKEKRKKWISYFKTMKEPKELTHKLVIMLIDKIIIYKEKRIYIQLRKESFLEK